MGEKVSCAALIVCGGYRVPIDLAKMDNDCTAIMQNAQQQVTVIKKMVQVTKAIEDTLTKLQPLWSAGTAAAGMAGAYRQICGSLNDLNGQGEDLGKQIQAIGKLLETVNRIIQFVKGANAMCAALMSNPFSMSAARACASATQVQTGTFLTTLTQFVNSLGQLVSAIQQATQGTSNAVSQVGGQLGYDPGGLPSQQQYPGLTPPFVPDPTAGQPTSGYPSYPSLPTLSPPAQTGIPNVFDSTGWIPKDSSTSGTGGGGSGGGTTGGSGTGEGLTIEITDADGDGKHEVKLHVPEGQLDKDLTVTVDAKVGDEEVKGDFKIDV